MTPPKSLVLRKKAQRRIRPARRKVRLMQRTELRAAVLRKSRPVQTLLTLKACPQRKMFRLTAPPERTARQVRMKILRTVRFLQGKEPPLPLRRRTAHRHRTPFRNTQSLPGLRPKKIQQPRELRPFR